MAWEHFNFIENQGEITGKSFRVQTEQAINDLARFSESVVEIGIGDAAQKAADEAQAKTIEELKSTAVLTVSQTLESGKKATARLNIGIGSVTQGTDSQTIDFNSTENFIINTSGLVTLTFKPALANEVCTKMISLTSTEKTTLKIVGATWSNKATAPVWGTKGKHLIISALFIDERVVLSVIDCDE